MKNKGRHMRIAAVICAVTVAVFIVKIFHSQLADAAVDILVFSAKSYIMLLSDEEQSGETYKEEIIGVTASKPEVVTSEKAEETVSVTVPEETTRKNGDEADENKADLTAVDEDVAAVMRSAKSGSEKDEKDGAISDYTYKKDGVTDSFGEVRVKNTNDTQVDIEAMLQEKADLSVPKDKPSVLIYHTHTTETYQLVDRDFYATGNKTRSDKEDRNMIRVGKAVKEELERAGYKVIHVTDIHDKQYNGAYARSRENIAEYLEQYTSVEITLDIHRDSIQRSDGTKIAPTVEINGKKAAQIMIIAGCQEEGNGITNLPDWRYNLNFALHLQQSLEKSFPGITRPIYFCARSYNMNLTHNSLLVEVGSDANTLEEAVYTGKCLGTALAELMKEYEEDV